VGLFSGIKIKFTDICYGLQKDVLLDINKILTEEFCCFFVLNIDASVRNGVWRRGGRVANGTGGHGSFYWF
jgi:hypothetical protein